jgi:hypothetical protein
MGQCVENIRNLFFHSKLFNCHVGKKTWINIYTKTVLPQSLQETFMSEDDGECGLNWGPELWNWQCKRPDSCVACQVPWNTTYTLKGICNSETE